MKTLFFYLIFKKMIIRGCKNSEKVPCGLRVGTWTGLISNAKCILTTAWHAIVARIVCSKSRASPFF